MEGPLAREVAGYSANASDPSVVVAKWRASTEALMRFIIANDFLGVRILSARINVRADDRAVVRLEKHQRSNAKDADIEQYDGRNNEIGRVRPRSFSWIEDQMKKV